jgi:hypothetical protein
VGDLHCPATLLLTDLGKQEVAGVAASLRGARVAAVYSSGLAAGPAGTVAAELGLRARTVVELDASGEGFGGALQTIADEHRGETVLVVTDAGRVSREVPRLTLNVPADFGAERPTEGVLVEIACDADGWVLRSWAGERVDQEKRGHM